MNLDYKNYNKKNDIHGTILYPATMVAPVQKDILLNLLDSNSINSINSIIDPFHGSATALYEASEVFPNAKIVGCDINPLANLIAKVKLSGIDLNSIENDINLLENSISVNSGIPIHEFHNSKKWFREDISSDLTKIRNSIIKIENKKNRLFFWYSLCNIIRKYSNTRSSTYKLHIKPEEKVIGLNNKVINDYLSSIKKNYHSFTKTSNNFSLYKTDSISQLSKFDKNSFDICITSPPYGDNQTTVTYGQFSMLSLYWIDNKDLNLEGWELENYSSIDSHSLGGTKNKNLLSYENRKLIAKYLNEISLQKQNKVIKFFSDYFICLEEICRITNNYVILTLGNRRVDNIKINLSKITKDYLKKHNFQEIDLIDRTIPKKRIPTYTSKVNNQPIHSMDKEYMLIYKKIK